MNRVLRTILCSTVMAYTMLAAIDYKWVVIGAGPAGIVSVAMLLENGVNPRSIAWIDPEFKVDRLGKYYGNVPSNQMAHRFTTFLNSCKIFKNVSSKSIHRICCNS